jgi:lactobin A/cerein 7B family class IIb bacteriocin
MNEVAMLEVNPNELTTVEGGIIPLLAIGAVAIVGMMVAVIGIEVGYAIGQALPCNK